MDEKLQYEITEWCRSIANCITTQPNWDEVYAQVLHLLTIYVVELRSHNIDSSTTSGELEWTIIRDRIKSKIQTLMEVYK